MKSCKWILFAVLCVDTLFLSFSAFAHGNPSGKDAKGFIIGFQAGYVENNWSDINQNAFANSNIIVSSDYGLGVRPYIGYVQNKYVAFELGYTYLGNADIQRWNAFGFNNFPQTKIRNWAVDLCLRLSAPLYDSAGLFATFGTAYVVSDNTLRWQSDLILPNTVLSNPPNTQHVASYQTVFGFGAYKDITCKMRVEIFWKHFEGNTVTDDLYQPSPDFYAVGFAYLV